MIKVDNNVTIIEGNQAVVGAELAAAIHVFRDMYGEEEVQEILRISKMGPEETLDELLKLAADMLLDDKK